MALAAAMGGGKKTTTTTADATGAAEGGKISQKSNQSEDGKIRVPYGSQKDQSGTPPQASPALVDVEAPAAPPAEPAGADAKPAVDL